MQKHILKFLNLCLFLSFANLTRAHALTIEELISITSNNHPLIESQIANTQASRADVKTAKQQFLPTPSISIEQVKSTETDATYGRSSTVNTYRLQQPIWTGGRLTSGLDRAESNAKATQEALNEVRQKMAFRAIQAWTDWYLATQRARVQSQSVNTHERLLNVVTRRVAEGAMANADLYLTQSRLEQAKSQHETYISQQKVAALKISQLMGHTMGISEKPEIGSFAKLCEKKTFEVDVINNAFALKKIAAQQEALGHELNEKKADLSPEVFVRLERLNGPTPYGANTMTNDRVYVGLASRFGAGLSSFTALESLEKRKDSLTSEYEASKRDILEAVASEEEQLSSITKKIPYLKNAANGATETLQSWDRQFLAGRRSWVEVMNAAKEAAQAEIEWADAKAMQISLQWRMSVYCGNVMALAIEIKNLDARQ